MNKDHEVIWPQTRMSYVKLSEQRASAPRIAIFVYGTLKSGQANHDRYCRDVIDIRLATTWGRLYALPVGYPALEMPEEHILAFGTDDPLADAATQASIANEIVTMPEPPRPTGDWRLIHGEFVIVAKPARNLPPIDRLEGFTAGGSSLYQRVLTHAYVDAKSLPAWVYIMQNPPGGVRLRQGRGRWCK